MIGRLLKTVDRKAYIVSTKVGRLFEPCDPHEMNSALFQDTPQLRFHFECSYDGVMRSYEESLERLDIDHVDISAFTTPVPWCTAAAKGRSGRFKTCFDMAAGRH